MNVEFEDEKSDPREGSAMMRRHTMSSISKQRNASLSEIMVKDKLLKDLTGNRSSNLSAFRPKLDEQKSDEQGGHLLSPITRAKILDNSSNGASPSPKSAINVEDKLE